MTPPSISTSDYSVPRISIKVTKSSVFYHSTTATGYFPFHRKYTLTLTQLNMSGNSNVGTAALYGAGDQRNAPVSELNQPERFEEGKQNSHKENDSSTFRCCPLLPSPFSEFIRRPRHPHHPPPTPTVSVTTLVGPVWECPPPHSTSLEKKHHV